jgi:hypothetical protein
MLEEVQKHHGVPNVITWKFGKNRIYMASSAYNMQFMDHTISYIFNGMETVGFSKIQEMTGKLLRRGWPTCGNCKLCNQVQKSVSPSLFGQI